MFPFDSPFRAAAQSRTGLRVAAMVGALGLAAFFPAHAEQHQAGDSARSVSASVDFRIVIPETLRLEDSREVASPTHQFTSRSVERVDGRDVVTVARP